MTTDPPPGAEAPPETPPDAIARYDAPAVPPADAPDAAGDSVGPDDAAQDPEPPGAPPDAVARDDASAAPADAPDAAGGSIGPDDADRDVDAPGEPGAASSHDSNDILKLEIPELALVLLIGASGSGKSTFARRHFRPTEVISSDTCRGLVSDDESDQGATSDAFDVVRFLAGKRLARRRLTVIDATNVSPDARRPLLELARAHHVLPVAIVLDVSVKDCVARNASRPDRPFGAHVVRRQHSQLRRSIRGLKKEGFRRVHRLRGPDEVERAELARARLWNDRADLSGPFDIIGDIHGCVDELLELLEALGYAVAGDPRIDAPVVTPPPGRTALFLGDLVDRGPAAPAVLRLVMGMVEAGTALCVPGNHEVKLLRWLQGKRVKQTHGLDRTVAQLEAEPKALRARAARFIDGLVSHYVLDGGRLVVAHAGLREELHGRTSGAVRSFALYGETRGESDAYGLPIRFNWAAEYRGRATVVYGHTPVPEARWISNTICVDTGCVFGGKLTALRYPERELVSVPARAVHYPPVRPLSAAAPTFDRDDDLLDIADVTGRRTIETRVLGPITVREELSAAALETVSRFAVDPHWLIYLPPTMSPSATRPEGELLEGPEEAFEYFASRGVARVLCEEKHMGSRAVVIVCRDKRAAHERFGARDGRDGIIYTRTGRAFLPRRRALEDALLRRVRAALTEDGFWERLDTPWCCLDAELMPWSLKARELVVRQYAATSAAARAALDPCVAAIDQALTRMLQPTGEGSLADADEDELAALSELLERTRARQQEVARFEQAWRRYCGPDEDVGDLRLAPFHVLATEGAVHSDKPHTWHMKTLAGLAARDPLLVATRTRLVELADARSRDAAARWWSELTAAGGEGMVVKPLDWDTRDARPGKRGLVQPALKVRGREYLRIIYGPEYTAPRHLDRLRARGLGRKRGLAAREYALGLEALHRFVAREPLYRVHECVVGVLALESTPVDPRL